MRAKATILPHINEVFITINLKPSESGVGLTVRQARQFAEEISRLAAEVERNIERKHEPRLTLSRLKTALRVYGHIIDEIVDESDADNGFWLYLKDGWHSPMDDGLCTADTAMFEDANHTIHEHDLDTILSHLKAVEPCHCCKGCRRAAAVPTT